MKNSELYVPVPSVRVEGFTHTEIQGQLASAKHTFKDGHICNLSCVSVNSKRASSDLVKISRLHGRAYEVRELTVFWEDEYGNLFSKLNTKGNNLTHPNIFIFETAPSGFLPYGMQESDAIVRVLKASELMRSQNIDSEVIVKVIEPATLPLKGKNLPLEEFKRRLIQKIWEDNAKKGDVDEKLNFQKPTRADLPKISTFLNDATFFITVRGLQVSERLADLYITDGDIFGSRSHMLKNAFDFINLEEEVKGRRGGYPPQHFSITTENIERYFTDYLPRKLARNFANLHELGLVHYFPHTGNISLVGSFYDLDSVRGEALGLGDNPITELAKINDLETFLLDRSDFHSMDAILQSWIDRPARFRNNFLRFYIEEMNLVEEDVAQFTDVCLRFNTNNVEDKMEMINYFTDQVINHTNVGPDDDIAGVFRFINKIVDFEGKYDFYHQLLQKLNVDQNVVSHVDLIDDLFNEWGFDGVSEKYLGFYLERLSKELDCNFTMEESLEEVIAKFHEADQTDARSEIESALEELRPGDDKEAEINAALHLSGGKIFQDFTFDPKGRYTEFGCKYIENEFDKIGKEKVIEWTEKYGERRAEIMREWFIKKYYDKYVNHYPKEIGDEIVIVANERIERLRQEYLSLAYST